MSAFRLTLAGGSCQLPSSRGTRPFGTAGPAVRPATAAADSGTVDSSPRGEDVLLVTVATRYTDPRAHELRDRYLATFGGDEIPVPVESIAEDLLGLRIEEADLGDCSGMLIPAERLILVNASEAMSGDTPTRRHRFTIAHELGHWICHAKGMQQAPTYCRCAGHRRRTPTARSSARRTSSAPSSSCRRLRCARSGQCAVTRARSQLGSTSRHSPRNGGSTASGWGMHRRCPVIKGLPECPTTQTPSTTARISPMPIRRRF